MVDPITSELKNYLIEFDSTIKLKEDLLPGETE
jgi:hypothetical protein